MRARFLRASDSEPCFYQRMEPHREDMLDDLDALKAVLAVAPAQNADDAATIASQKLEIAKLKRQIHGHRSERTARLIEQTVFELDEAAAATEDDIAVNATPVTWYVHVDHLNRPIKMTDAAKASVWDAVWQPWGGQHTITGTAVLDARFPGQWFQLETGLHYNWNRTYDPTIGRYTQPDPLGFVDGPSVFGYAGGSPQSFVDQDGLLISGPAVPTIKTALTQCEDPFVDKAGVKDFYNACIDEVKRLPAHLKKNARQIVIACIAAYSHKRLPPPPPPPRRPPVERPVDPPPPPGPPPPPPKKPPE